MRVHGSVKINRRTDIELQTDYSKYKDILREDFGYICGYCGKSEKVTKNTFEIDHFVPQSLAPEREADYENLVYSCFTCNRKKSNKWPTENKNLCNDGKIGFIDPASVDYDVHLARNDDGSISGVTSVGVYMCNNVFKFKLRPIKELWLCSEILLRQELLESKIAQMSSEEAIEYIEINQQLKELQQFLFSKRE